VTFTLHRGAERDLGDAARFYRNEAGRAVAARFIEEFERIAMLLSANQVLDSHSWRASLVSVSWISLLRHLPSRG